MWQRPLFSVLGILIIIILVVNDVIALWLALLLMMGFAIYGLLE